MDFANRQHFHGQFLSLHLLICYIHIISPNDIGLNPASVLEEWEIWRVVTNFFYFGQMDLEFMANMLILAQVLPFLERTSFNGRKGDFFYMLLCGWTFLTAPVLIGGMIPHLSESFTQTIFLSNSMTFMVVYVCCKHFPFMEIRFMGFFTYPAAYYPWVLMGASSVLFTNGYACLMGMISGHVYHYFDQVYPIETGRRPLKTPAFIKAMFADDPNLP